MMMNKHVLLPLTLLAAGVLNEGKRQRTVTNSNKRAAGIQLNPLCQTELYFDYLKLYKMCACEFHFYNLFNFIPVHLSV